MVVVIDRSLEGRKNLVCGANKLDYHLRNVTPGRDFTWTLIADIRSVNEGESCPKEGCAGKLVVGKAVEVGHIFKLGYKYTRVDGRARARRERQGSDADHGQLRHRHRAHSDGGHRAVERRERLLAARLDRAVHRGGHGHQRPPMQRCAQTGEKLAADLESAGLDVLLDDRDERAGVKFKDADLVGIPYRINVGKKAAAGQVELVTRATSTSVDVALERSGGAGEEARPGRIAARSELLASHFRPFVRGSRLFQAHDAKLIEAGTAHGKKLKLRAKS